MRRIVWAAVLLAVLAGCAPDSTATPPTFGSSTTSPAPRTAEPDTLLVADFGADTVTFVDPERGALDSVQVGTAPYGLAVGADGRAWVATADGVAVVDTATRTRIGRVPYRTDGIGEPAHGEYRGGGMGIAIAPDGRHVYVGVNRPGDNGTVEVIDTGTLTVTGVAEVGRRPFDVDVAADGREVYATGHDSFDVTVVDANTLATRRIEVAPYGTEGGLGSWLKPHYAVVRPAGGHLLLPFEGERLVDVDPATGRSRIEPMTADTHQHGAALTADGTLLVVGTGPIVPADDHGPSLTIRPENGKERVIPLNGPHEDVVSSRDGRTAYVTGGFTRDGYWNGITVVDLATGDTRRLTVGARPLGIAIL
jgi:YVTN family beta-propeller protein